MRSSSAKSNRRRFPKCEGVVLRGRNFTQEDFLLIRKLVRDNPSWGRTRLSKEVCLRFGWLDPTGRTKERACRVALLRAEELGFVELPLRKLERGGRPPKLHTMSDCGVQLVSVSSMPYKIEIVLAKRRKEKQLWNAMISDHHYLGLGMPVGRSLRYLVYGDAQLLGGISFGEPAWTFRARDQLLARIGLGVNGSRDTVFSNTRFLLLPTVRVRNLASRVLSRSLRCASTDWTSRFGTSPRFVETFVDPARFTGACYLAANWLKVGETAGFSKRGASHNPGCPKLAFLRGIQSADHRTIEYYLNNEVADVQTSSSTETEVRRAA